MTFSIMAEREDGNGGLVSKCATFESSSNQAACFTASWELIWRQLVAYAVIQVPIIVLALIYEWLKTKCKHQGVGRNLVRNTHRLSSCLRSPLVQCINGFVQLLGSIFIMLAWTTRGGSLAVDLPTWSIESSVDGLLFLSYVLRWVAASNKIAFSFQLNTIFDLLSIVSHYVMSFETIERDGVTLRSWLDFGFLRSFIVYAIFGNLTSFFRTRTFVTQMVVVACRALLLIFFCATVLFALEVLGEVPGVNSFIFHVYKCPVDQSNSNATVLRATTEGFKDCKETWSAFVAVYFMFVTVSTVGYGDFAPDTVLGRTLLVFIIIVGIYMFAHETSRLVNIFEDSRMGRNSYHAGQGNKSVGSSTTTTRGDYGVHRHVLVVGNPSLVQTKDFLREFYHPDHLSFTGDDSSFSLPDVVILTELDIPEEERSFHIQIQEYIDQSPHLRGKVHRLAGSVLNVDDLVRAQLSTAEAVFFLPNKYELDANREDAANVLRVLSVSKFKSPHTQVFAMLLNADNRLLLEATGLFHAHNLVCVDEIKMGLMGLSCRCRGLSTLISNLVSSRSNEVPPSIPQHLVWAQEYVAGAANEIYACTLHAMYCNKTFTQATQEVHRRTGGMVLLIAVEDAQSKEILYNPGHSIVVSPHLKVYAIAESSEAMKAIQGDQVTFFSNPISFFTLLRARPNLVARANRARHKVERNVPRNIRNLLIQYDHRRMQPPMPTEKILHEPHIVIYSNFSSDEAHSLDKLRKFLHPLRSAHVLHDEPVVIVDPNAFPDIIWAQLSEYKHVYLVQGNPQDHDTLKLAGIANASAIVVLAQTKYGNFDDTHSIFNSILIDSAVRETETFSIIELTDVRNNKFLDPVAQHGKAKKQRIMSYRDDLVALTSATKSKAKAKADGKMQTESKTETMPVHDEIAASTRAFLTRSLEQFRQRLSWMQSKILAWNAKINQASNSSRTTLSTLADEANDTFFHERFVCGALFPSFVVDDLLIQAYYNPAMTGFVQSILSGKSCFMLYQIPSSLRRPDLTYGELFVYMTSGISTALPIGLLRAPHSTRNQSEREYVYTSPPANTKVYENDRMFVIINETTLNSVAQKIQRQLRVCKHWVATTQLTPARHDAKVGEKIKKAP